MAITLRTAATAVLFALTLALPATSHAFDFPFLSGGGLSSEDKKAIDELEKKQDWNGMRELTGKRLKTNDKEAGWPYLDGYALQKLERCSEAIPRFRLALVLRPGYADAQNELGRCLLATGQLDAAQSTFTSLVGNNPDYWQAYYNLALVYIRKQDPRSARIYMEQLKSKNAAMAREIEEGEIKPFEARLEQARFAAAEREREAKARIERERLEKEVDDARAKAEAQAAAERLLQAEPKAAATPPKSREAKLKELKRLYAKKLITKDVYRARQKELLAE